MDELLGEARFDSHGTFTVDPRKAIEKLAQAQLPDKTYWQLKLIQSGVAAVAPRIDISLGTSSSRITFVPEDEWTLERIEADLLLPQASPTRALYHLKQALWNVAFFQQLDFELKCPGQPEALVYQSGQLKRHKAQPENELRLTVRHAPDPDYLRQARELAYLCPVPLTVGHQRIDGLFAEDQPVHMQSLPSPLFITRTAGPSLLHWVHDGVILEREELPIRLNRLRCDLFFSARNLTTDAAGLKLVRDEAYQERRAEACQQLAQAVRDLQLKAPPPYDKNPARLVLGAACLVTGLVNPLFIPAIAMLGGAALTAYEAERDNRTTDRDVASLKASLHSELELAPNTSAGASSHTEDT